MLLQELASNSNRLELGLGKLAWHDLKVDHPAQYAKLKTSLMQGSKNKFSIVKAIIE